jgi:hypothetical protein
MLGGKIEMLNRCHVTWCVIAVSCLAYVLYTLNTPALPATTDNQDIILVLLLVMSLLVFPIGILVSAGFVYLYTYLLPGRNLSSIDFIIMWSVFVVIGYLQWVKLLPFLKRRRHKSQGA